MHSYGRKVIYTNESIINDSNICSVLEKAFQVHKNNVADMEYLAKYEAGEQPILLRKKEVRPEINNKVVENNAHKIVDFKDGYEFGSPITYVQRAGKETPDEGDEDTDNENINRLNEMLFNEGKFDKDLELGNTLHIKGVAYRLVLPSDTEDSCFSILNLPPENTFVVRTNDVFKKVVLGVSYRVESEAIEDKNEVIDRIVFGCYTDSSYYEIVGNVSGINPKIVSKSPNGIGVVPIVEYINDYKRMGSFERVIPLLDAINLGTSDRMNGLAQFIQSFIWFNNVDIDEEQFKSMKDLGAIKTKSSDGLQAGIQTLEVNLNQTEVQTLLDDLRQQVAEIVGIPTREQSTGGNTGQALMLGGSGWQMAETAAKKTELLFSRGEKEVLKIIARVIDKSNINGFYIKPSDIEIKFSRNKVSNLLTKTQGLQNQLEAGIHPRIAIANCDLYSDPQQVYMDSVEYLSKWLVEKTEEVVMGDGNEPEPKVDEDGNVVEQNQVQPLD